MSKAAEKQRLAGEFLELTRRLEILRYAEEGDGNKFDPEKLARWQTLYGDEVTNVLQNRAVYRDQPAAVSGETLQEWIAYARQVLTDDPVDGLG